MDLCGACGAVALEGARSCGVCEGALEPRRRGVPDLPAGISLVGVRCRFQCRGCGHLAPLDGLDLDGTVRCARCGLEQAFDADSWGEALAFAHDVADLCGPEPEGRTRDPRYSIADENPYQEVGLHRVWSTHAVSGEVRRGASVLQRSLELRAHPGRPVCACGEPLALQGSGERVEARCAACGRRRDNRLPREARRLHDGLCGVFAATDGAPVPWTPGNTRGLTGSLGYSCPGCGAPLPVTGNEAVVTCSFCKLATRIASVSGLMQDRPPAVFWLAFRGASPERTRLLRQDQRLPDDPGVVLEPPQGTPNVRQKLARTVMTYGFPLFALAVSGLAIFAALVAMKK